MLVITLGDPKSINVRAILCLMKEIPDSGRVLLIGSWGVWQDQSQRLGSLPIAGEKIGNDRQLIKLDSLESALVQQKGIYFFDPLEHTLGEVCTEDLYKEHNRGAIAYESLNAVKKITALIEKDSSTLSRKSKLAVLTCPIDKKVTTKAGFAFPGQTEFFSSIWQGDSIMILAGPKLRVGLVTNHLALSEVEENISENIVIQKYKTFEDSLSILLNKEDIKIAVCGLNPHLSDGGMFGVTEKNILFPAQAKLTECGHLSELAPADTAFFFALQGKYDGVLAMYHDQGLGPLKTVHFDNAINITGGLKHVRVSPDHGPAGDKMESEEISLRSFRMALNHCISYLEKV
jgi:4-hydroxy-L-threonine phosphate dehydrogenase PdxA